MPKRKPLTIIRSLEELISDYDRPTLVRALEVVKGELGFQILRAALMKEYLNTVAYSLDNSSKTGKQIEAAYYAGAAQTMYDTATSLIDKYQEILAQKVGVVEAIRPEE